MINDSPRNEAFYRALELAIVPGVSVVLDVGSGTTGLLAMMSAQLGAKKVFSLEANEAIATIAIETISRNGFQDRIEVIPCVSFDTTIGPDVAQSCASLSERATILVSETVSTFLTSEGMVATIEDARRRLCVPDAVVVPSRARLIAAAVHSDELLARTYVGWWRGFDLRATNALRATDAARQVDMALLPDARLLTNKQTVLELDLTKYQSEPGLAIQPGSHETYSKSFELNVLAEGVASFACWWFELDLFGGVTIDSDPDRNAANRPRQQHWGQACTASNFRDDARPSGARGRSSADRSISDWRVLPGDTLNLALSLRLNGRWPTPAFSLTTVPHRISETGA